MKVDIRSVARRKRATDGEDQGYVDLGRAIVLSEMESIDAVMCFLESAGFCVMRGSAWGYDRGEPDDTIGFDRLAVFPAPTTVGQEPS